MSMTSTCPASCMRMVLRSPHGHAAIDGIDTAAARAMPGVRGVFTAADLDADGIGPLPCIAQVATVAPIIVPPRRALARDRVRHVGDPVAFVVADTREQARDAAERIEVAYRPLPAVVDATAALPPGAPLLWDEAPGNLSYRFERGDKAAVEAAFAGAAHVVEIELVNNRLVVAPIEPRAAIGIYDAAADRFELLLTGQGVHSLRQQLADCGVPHAARAHRRARARCRRRVRHQELPLSRMGAGAVGGAAARPAGQMGRRARRGFRQLGAGPRQPYRGAAGARPRRPVSGARRRDGRQSRRLSVDQRPGQLDQLASQRDGRRLRDPGGVHGGARRLHQHGADRRLSRRRQARSQLPDRAAGRSCRAPAAARSGGVAPAQPDQPISRIAAGSGSRSIADGLPPISTRWRGACRREGFAARRQEAAKRGRLRGLGIACFLETSRGTPGERAEIRFEGGRPRRAGARHAIERPGPRNQLSADRRRSAGTADRALSVLSRPTRATVKSGNGHGGARSMHMGGAALHQAAQMVHRQGPRDRRPSAAGRSRTR